MLKSILVCSDYQVLEEWRQLILENTDLSISGEYSNPVDALKEAPLTNPDCAVLELDMPGLNGLELASSLMEVCPQLETVLIGKNKRSAFDAYEIGAMDYLIMPVRAERLMRTVERLKKRKNVQAEIGNPKDSKVSIRTLGDFSVLVDGKPIYWSRAKSRELLAYLLNRNGEAVNKYQICDDLWPGCDRRAALTHLQTAVGTLRKNLSAVNRKDIRIEYSQDNYLLQVGTIDWDQMEFEKSYACYITNGSAEFGERAVQLYTGDYLGSPEWSWVRPELENLNLKYIDLVCRLCCFYIETGRCREAQERIRMLMEKHPQNEELQLLLLDSALRMDGVAGLKAQYNKLKDFLRNEFSEDVADLAQLFYDKSQSQKMN